jgi:hypothetical protein
VVDKVDVALIGGPLDGRLVDVEIDESRLPPDHLTESQLWFIWGSELLDADRNASLLCKDHATCRPESLCRAEPQLTVDGDLYRRPTKLVRDQVGARLDVRKAALTWGYACRRFT